MDLISSLLKDLGVGRFSNFLLSKAINFPLIKVRAKARANRKTGSSLNIDPIPAVTPAIVKPRGTAYFKACIPPLPSMVNFPPLPINKASSPSPGDPAIKIARRYNLIGMPSENITDEGFKNNPSLRNRIRNVIETLEPEFQVNVPEGDSPFMILVRTVISQNTNRKNTNTAFGNLIPDYSSPSDFAEADLEDLEDLLRPGGLYKSKSRSLKDLSKIIVENYDGDISKILDKPQEDAREALMDLPGVGPKTADCVLLFSGRYDTIPVDTHVDRTAKRLGFADPEDDPEGVKESLEPLIPEGYRGKGHLLLIELGRNYCKANNPLCKKCPIEDLCPKIGLG